MEEEVTTDLSCTKHTPPPPRHNAACDSFAVCDAPRSVDCSLRLIEGGVELHAVTVLRQRHSGLAAVTTVQRECQTSVFSIQYVVRKQSQAHIYTHARTQSICCIAVTDG